jgi:hypothetical protein
VGYAVPSVDNIIAIAKLETHQEIVVYLDDNMMSLEGDIPNKVSDILWRFGRTLFLPGTKFCKLTTTNNTRKRTT